MIPQELIAAIGKLLRDMPRNPTAIEVGEALNRAVAATPVVATPAAKAVAATECPGCPGCAARRERQRDKMRNYRASLLANANAQKS